MIKPTVILIMIVSVTGYFFASRCHLTAPKFAKTDGYHTFLTSALYGSLLLILSTLIYSLITFIFSGVNSFVEWLTGLTPYGFSLPSFRDMLRSYIEFVFPNTYVSDVVISCMLIVSVSILLTFLLPRKLIKVGMKLTNAAENELRWNIFKKLQNTEYTNEFTSLLVRSIDTGLPIAFTLSNRKVYIGYAFITANHSNDITVLPLKSGYRCDKELRLINVTDYNPVFEEMKKIEGEDKSLQKFLISLALREIVHANLHDFHYGPTFKKYELPPNSFVGPMPQSQE